MGTPNYNSGKLISNIDAVLIFIRTAPGDWVDQFAVPGTPVPVPFVCEMTTFVYDLVDSAYMDAVSAAYSVPNLKLGRGKFGGTFYLDVAPAPATSDIGPSDVLDADIRQAMLDAIGLGTLPQPSENTVYIVLTPGEVLWWEGLTGTPAGGGGYHSQIWLSGVQSVSYCVIGSASLGTAAITHEIVEAITDSDLSGWVDRSQNPGQEVVGLCFPRTVKFHGNDVSTFFSPVTGKCVGPADDILRKPGASVRIVGGRPYCDGGLLAGQHFTVAAEVTYLGLPESVASYRWYSADAQIDNVSSATPTLTAPAVPGFFKVDVSVITAHGCVIGAQRQYRTVTQDESAWFRTLCQLVKHLPRRPPMHVNPLWDPLRDLITHPLSRDELATVKRYVQGLNRVVEHLEAVPGENARR